MDVGLYISSCASCVSDQDMGVYFFISASRLNLNMGEVRGVDGQEDTWACIVRRMINKGYGCGREGTVVSGV